MAIPTTHNLEALLARTKQEAVAAWIDALPTIEDPGDRLEAVKAIIGESYERESARKAAIIPLGPDTLVGLYFRAPDQDDPNAEAAWLANEPGATVEGIVVGQPFTSTSDATYRVEWFGEHGAAGYQELVDLSRMNVQRWRFYDRDTWLSSKQPQAAITTDREPAELTERTEAGA